MLTRDDVVEFRNLWSARFKEDITEQEAKDQAESLLRIMLQVYQPVSLVQVDNLE